MTWAIGINYSISVTSLYKPLSIAYENSSFGDPEATWHFATRFHVTIVLKTTKSSTTRSFLKVLTRSTISYLLISQYILNQSKFDICQQIRNIYLKKLGAIYI